MEERYVTLGKLLENPDEAQKLFEMSSEEAAAYLSQQHGLEFTVDELNDVADGIKRALSESGSDELSENDLETVAGGKNSGAYYAGYYIGKGIKFAGAGLGIAAGLVALGVVSW